MRFTNGTLGATCRLARPRELSKQAKQRSKWVDYYSVSSILDDSHSVDKH